MEIRKSPHLLATLQFLKPKNVDILEYTYLFVNRR